MLAVRIGKLLEYGTGRGLVFGLLWAGLACLTVGLAALLLTRWGQSRPLRKCLALSVFAHLLFAIYSTTVQIFVGATLPAEDPGIHVQLLGEETPQDRPFHTTGDGATPMWERLIGEKSSLPTPEPDRQAHSLPEADRPGSDPSLPAEIAMPELRPKPEAIASRTPPPTASQPMSVQNAAENLRPRQGPEPVESPTPQRREAAMRPMPLESSPGRPSSLTGIPPAERMPLPGAPPGLVEIPLPTPTQPPHGTQPTGSSSPPPALAEGYALDSAGGEARAGAANGLAWQGPAPAMQSPLSASSLAGRDAASSGLLSSSAIPKPHPLLSPTSPRGPGEIPKLYQARTAPNRPQWAAQHGATEQTEKAVQDALAWLAAHQESDGRWDAARHGAGREMFVGGRNRQGSGAQAHTAVTGLALLAFLGRGYTHQQGEYQKTVAQGLEYLLRHQGADGNLGAQADFYAFMYCHGIAALALSEAYAMTQDPRLREPLRQAITYTLAAQHPEQGGWRYRPRDPGDASQLGWQLLALKSAELAGIGIPQASKQGAWRFVQSVSSGRFGGLASYRALETPSPAMTAEVLLCRLFLGAPANDPACQEAGQYLLSHLPGQGEPNLYYWYYGTLSMFQLGGPYWTSWNEALQKTLLPRQQKNGTLAGSWDPDTRWDNYGGRIYCTALSTLCLEVYYRYLPIYIYPSETAPAHPTAPAK